MTTVERKIVKKNRPNFPEKYSIIVTHAAPTRELNLRLKEAAGRHADEGRTEQVDSPNPVWESLWNFKYRKSAERCKARLLAELSETEVRLEENTLA
jgi:hypothetical protein